MLKQNEEFDPGKTGTQDMPRSERDEIRAREAYYDDICTAVRVKTGVFPSLKEARRHLQETTFSQRDLSPEMQIRLRLEGNLGLKIVDDILGSKDGQVTVVFKFFGNRDCVRFCEYLLEEGFTFKVAFHQIAPEMYKDVVSLLEQSSIVQSRPNAILNLDKLKAGIVKWG